MPSNTRVGRCVAKLKKKYKYGKAIGICQYSTKQNYLTGKTISKKKRKTRKRKTKKRNHKKRKRKWSNKYKKSIQN